MFFMNTGIYLFCTVNSFHQQIMFWLEGAEAEGYYFKQENYHPNSPWCRLINTVNRSWGRIVGLGLVLGWCGVGVVKVWSGSVHIVL